MRKVLLATAVLGVLVSGVAIANSDKDKISEKFAQRQEQQKALIAKLPEEKATLLKETMQQLRTDKKVLRDQVKALRKQTKEILTAEKFDEDAYAAKVKQMQDVYEKMSDARTKAISSLAEKMTAEERQILAEVALDKHRWQGKHRGDKKDQPKSEGEDRS